MLDKHKYKRDGFLLLRSLSGKDEILRVQEEAIDVFRVQLRKQQLDIEDFTVEAGFNKALYALFEEDFQQVVNCERQIRHLVSPHRLGTDYRIGDALTALGVTFPRISHNPVLFSNSRHLAKRRRIPASWNHQDWRNNQGPLDSITMRVPLVDIDQSLGALEVIPGSHRWGFSSLKTMDTTITYRSEYQ